jgi:hypothetical protein
MGLSMGETVDDHDGFVMWVVDARGFEEAMWLRWDADMMCSADQGILVDGWPTREEL